MNHTELKAKAIQIRMDLLKMIHGAKTGHTGGSLSNTDILTALYYKIMKIDQQNPKWTDRDRFIASKGHSVESLVVHSRRPRLFPERRTGDLQSIRHTFDRPS